MALTSTILDPTTEVKLYDLLSQRERAFAKIYEYEQRIEHILGKEYSAFAVPQLPSTAKKRRKAAKKAKAPKRTIRRLKPETEDAYLIEFDYNGHEQSEILREFRLVQLLVKNDIPNIRLKYISSIKYSSDNEYEHVMDLYNAPSDNG